MSQDPLIYPGMGATVAIFVPGKAGLGGTSLLASPIESTMGRRLAPCPAKARA
jgi:hypothetical protein